MAHATSEAGMDMTSVMNMEVSFASDSALRPSLKKVLVDILNALGNRELDTMRVLLSHEFLDDPDFYQIRNPSAADLLTRLEKKYRCNPFRMVEVLHKFVEQADYSWEDMRLERLKQLYESLRREAVDLGLVSSNRLFGRTDELEQIVKLLRNPTSARVINICGVAGIGKSYLSKFVRLDLMGTDEWRCLSVDGRGIGTVKDLLVTLLKSVGFCSGGSVEDQTAQLLSKLKEVTSQSKKVLVTIDDTSQLLPEDKDDEISDFLHLICHLVNKTNQNVLFLLTSKVRLSSSQVDSDIELPEFRRKMAAFTVDVELSPLSNKDALEALSGLNRLSELKRSQLLEASHGHPFTLAILATIAEDGVTGYESLFQQEDTVKGAQNQLMEHLYQSDFNNLKTSQKRLLLALTLFEGKTEMHCLLKVLKPDLVDESEIRGWCMKVKTLFLSRFWVSVQDVDNEQVDHHLVGLYHPITHQFLKQRIQEFADWQNEFKKNFVKYFVDVMLELGKDCLTKRSSALNRMALHHLNIKQCLRLLTDMKDPSLLLPDSVERFSQLLCFVSEMFDAFDLQKLLMEMTSTLKAKSVFPHPSIRVLMLITQAFTAAICSEWSSARDALDPVVLRPPDIDTLINNSKDLYYFVLGLQEYLHGWVLHIAPWHYGKAQYLPRSLEKYDHALAYWKQLSRSAATVSTEYFRIRVSISLSLVYFSMHQFNVEKTSRGDHLDISLKILDSALKQIDFKGKRMECLLPRILLELATVLAQKGDEAEVKTAIKQYSLSGKYRRQVIKVLRDQHMLESSMAALNYLTYAIMLRSWAWLLLEADDRPSRCEFPISLLVKACRYGERAVKAFQRLSTGTNNRALIRANVQHAETLEVIFDKLKRFRRYLQTTPDWQDLTAPDCPRIDRYRKRALACYMAAYNLVKHYRTCGLSPDEHTLKQLMERLPNILASEQGKDQVDKVNTTLQIIQSSLRKEVYDSSSPSASSMYMSSDPSDDESSFPSEFHAKRDVDHSADVGDNSDIKKRRPNDEEDSGDS